MSDSHDKMFDSAIDHAKSAYHDHRYDEAKEYLNVGMRMIPIKKMKGKPEIVEVVEEKKEYNYGMWAFVIIIILLLFWLWMGILLKE